MNRNKGIVVDVTDTQIVLMSISDGTFKNIPRPPDYVPLLGEEMEITQITKRKLTPWTKFASVACMVLLLFSAMVLFTQKKAEEAYMVALDINPSLELYTDSRLLVTRVVARNRDGERVLQQVEYKDKPLRDVMKLVIDNCVDMDYLQPDRKKTIHSTLIPLSDAPPIQETEVKEMIFQPLQERKINADIEVTTGDAKMIKVSEKLDISVNKVKLYEQLQEKHVPITVEDVKNTSIDKLQQKSDMSRDKEAGRQNNVGSGHTVREADGKTTTKGSETRAIDSHDSVKSVNREQNVGGSSKSDPDPVYGEVAAVNPNSEEAETAEPDTVEMKPEEPDTGGLETTKSDSAGTDMSGKGEALTKESDAADPGSNVVETANPDPVKPEMAAEHDTVETKPEEPGAGGLKTAEPDSAGTDMSGEGKETPTDPGSKETEAAGPYEAGLETAEPDSAQTEASLPKGN